MSDFRKETTAKIMHLQTVVHTLARSKGWYSPPKTDLECLMLMVSELSEAAEQIRTQKPNEYVQDGKPEGLSIELADVVLRILDYCEYKKINLGEAIFAKHEFNKTRPFRHGGKAA